MGHAGCCVGGRVVNHGIELQGYQEAWVVSRVVSCRVEFQVTKELLVGHFSRPCSKIAQGANRGQFARAFGTR